MQSWNIFFGTAPTSEEKESKNIQRLWGHIVHALEVVGTEVCSYCVTSKFFILWIAIIHHFKNCCGPPCWRCGSLLGKSRKQMVLLGRRSQKPLCTSWGLKISYNGNECWMLDLGDRSSLKPTGFGFLYLKDCSCWLIPRPCIFIPISSQTGNSGIGRSKKLHSCFLY